VSAIGLDIVSSSGKMSTKADQAQYRSTRVQAERAQTAARLRAKRAVQLLAGGGMRLSRRDTADVLGVSFQRIQQLIKT
jgi:hypothetical protein